jgi:hypothetical protein
LSVAGSDKAAIVRSVRLLIERIGFNAKSARDSCL